jgi:hypothetical protein
MNKTDVGDEKTTPPAPSSWTDWKNVALPEVDLNSEEVLGGEESDEAISTVSRLLIMMCLFTDYVDQDGEDSDESSDDEEDEEDVSTFKYHTG